MRVWHVFLLTTALITILIVVFPKCPPPVGLPPLQKEVPTSAPVPMKRTAFCDAETRTSGECSVQHVQSVFEKSKGCGSLFREGRFRGLRICGYPPGEDGHISAPMLQGRIPGMEQAIFGIAETHLKSNASKGWVVDAGANIGLFTYLGITLNHSVVAIDPVTEHVEMLRRSASMNGIPNERMIVLQNAISGHCGRAKIDFGHKMKNPGGSSIAWKEPSSKSEAASVITMDEVFAFTRNAPVHLLKIDVEGQEPWLLNGMSWNTRPRMIVMELFNPRILSHGCSIQRIFEQLVLVLHYKLRVFPRLALRWDSNTVVATKEDLEKLMRVIKRESEMDVILY